MNATASTSTTSTPSNAAAPRALLLRELLAACFSVGSHAGAVIRDVVHQGVDLGVVNKADDKYDPQTVADRRSQQRIIYALRQVWPHVQIVGEEGELAHPEPEDVVVADVEALNSVDFTVPDALTGELSAADVVLWIDPLDGTKKFAEKKYDEVSVLIGVAYKKRPIVGVMHLPFWGPHGTTFWGGPGIGLFKTTHDASLAQTVHTHITCPTLKYPDRALVLTTSGTKCTLVDAALESLAPASVTLGGATGTMVLTVITGESDVFLRFRNATKRWDICAVEPLLEAIGGSLVDKHGCAYEYDPQSDGPEFDNGHGLIVSLSPMTTKWVLDTMTRIEMLRTIDGDGAITPAWLSGHVFYGQARVLTASIVPGSVHRGKQSCVFKLRVVYTRDAAGDGDAAAHELQHARTLFVKRYVQSELPPRSDAHWQRDLVSYRTESRFYARFHAALSVHVALIEPLAVIAGRHDDRFLLVLDSVVNAGDDHSAELRAAAATATPRRYEHTDCLSASDAAHALQYLAKLHAGALSTPGLVAQAALELWPTGGWWSYDKRGGEQGLEHAESVWAGVRSAFAAEIAELSTPTRAPALEALARRMTQHAAYISAELFERSPAAVRTLVHGDFKSANLFFDCATRDVVAFDWQWCGVAIGALDVAYLLNTSVAIDALAPESEQRLLRDYYDAFMAQCPVTTRRAAAYTFEAFERHYMLATLEYARVLLAGFWRGMTPASCATKFANTNCGLGYRSVPHVVRMIEKLDNGLHAVERERGREDEASRTQQ